MLIEERRVHTTVRRVVKEGTEEEEEEELHTEQHPICIVAEPLAHGTRRNYHLVYQRPNARNDPTSRDTHAGVFPRVCLLLSPEQGWSGSGAIGSEPFLPIPHLFETNIDDFLIRLPEDEKMFLVNQRMRHRDAVSFLISRRNSHVAMEVSWKGETSCFYFPFEGIDHRPMHLAFLGLPKVQVGVLSDEEYAEMRIDSRRSLFRVECFSCTERAVDAVIECGHMLCLECLAKYDLEKQRCPQCRIGRLAYALRVADEVCPVRCAPHADNGEHRQDGRFAVIPCGCMLGCDAGRKSPSPKPNMDGASGDVFNCPRCENQAERIIKIFE